MVLSSIDSILHRHFMCSVFFGGGKKSKGHLYKNNVSQMLLGFLREHRLGLQLDFFHVLDHGFPGSALQRCVEHFTLHLGSCDDDDAICRNLLEVGWGWTSGGLFERAKHQPTSRVVKIM